MAPATVTLDMTSDFSMPTTTTTTTSTGAGRPRRTLLLAAPSLASNEALLKTALGPHDRATSDLQMLDRLSAGLISLPPSTYDLVILLAGAAGAPEEAALLDRGVLGSVHDALTPGGRLEGEVLAAVGDKEFVLAGLVAAEGGAKAFVRPDYGEGVVSLKLRRRKKEPVAEKAVEVKAQRGVGFVSMDDLDGDDDELIDESTLLTESDLKRPLNIRMLSRPCGPFNTPVSLVPLRLSLSQLPFPPSLPDNIYSLAPYAVQVD